MENTEKLTITAVIPAYNAEKYITRSIDSVLSQTHPVDEIVVVDDGSTDSTPEIIKRYGDKVRYVHQQNAGVSAARNTGIQAAAGNWIAFLDADDEWLPTFVEKNMEVLKLYPDLAWIISNFYTCSCFENRRAPRAAPKKAKKILKEQRVIEDYFLGCLYGFQGCSDTVLIKKEVLLEAGLFKTDIHKGEDMDLWWRIAYRHLRVGLVAEPLAIYHISVQGSGNKRTENWQHYSKIISEHLVLSEKQGRLHNFKPYAIKLVCIWIRGMLFQAKREDIRHLLQNYRSLIPIWYRCLMYGLTVFPKLTRAVLLLISKVVRTLKLRKRVVMPPNK